MSSLDTREPRPVGPAEIAELLGVSRNRAYQLRGKPDFPKAKWETSYGPLWDAWDIIDWDATPRRTGRPPASTGD